VAAFPPPTSKESYQMSERIGTVRIGSRVSSGSIVSDYWLDDRAIGVRSPAGAEDFFL
jgi:hypothetical protein